jgi:hypothetical protein
MKDSETASEDKEITGVYKFGHVWMLPEYLFIPTSILEVH